MKDFFSYWYGCIYGFYLLFEFGKSCDVWPVTWISWTMVWFLEIIMIPKFRYYVPTIKGMSYENI